MKSFRSGSTTTSRSGLLASACALLLGTGALAATGSASAQAPDIRSIRPAVMLLVDTSGSMEYAAGQPSGTLPMCNGSAATSTRSRWTTVLEALTGSWPSFSCTSVTRSTAYPTAPDAHYMLPYHRPPVSGQSSDGILDNYLDRVKFGLMTYDNVFGLTTTESELMVPQSVFSLRLAESQAAAGDYSYGGMRPLTFPGCTTTFAVDGGARHSGAPAGAMVSVGSDAVDYHFTNALIQEQLLSMRPFGATPTAAMLDDFRVYLQTHPDVAPVSAGGGDPYQACRPRYAILLTDGQPNDPYRDFMNCGASGYACPYDRPSAIAADLCRYNSASRECTGLVDGLFVVGFDVGDPTAQALLDDLADRGGTESATIATDRASLIAALGAALDRAAPGTTTRTAPVMATGGGQTTSTGPGTQYQFNSGFQVGTVDEPLWSGVLDRTRYVCDASNVPVRQPLDPAQDSFHEILNDRNVSSSPRRLLTVVTGRTNEMAGVVLGEGDAIAPLGAGAGGTGAPGPGRGGGGAGGRGRTPPVPTVVRGERLEAFDTSNTNLTPAYFGLSGGSASSLTTRRDAIINWVHGRPGTARADNRFGDIYHSTPVVVGPPRSDIADEWFNLFRRRPDVANRPTVVYVATNDGILHAFASEQWTDLRTGETYDAGEEIWGFIPPAVISRLESATTSHQILFDGTPVVRDVFYLRKPGDQPTDLATRPDSYRTVLVVGLRGGGPHYIALDVTDPINPKFLWQYTAQFMGSTVARAAIGQVLIRVGGVLQERAIAILPGGAGEIDVDGARTTGPVGCPSQGIGTPPDNDGVANARSRQRCWGRVGRTLEWVDMVTGERLFSFDDRTFSAPVSGAASLFTGDTGTLATRAFMTDDDGVLWRIDFSSPDMTQWKAEPFFDIFHDLAPTEVTLGQPGYEPPVLTTDTEGNVVVIQATGNIDQLDSNVRNRVVSLTERLDSTAAQGFRTGVNWEIWLRPGEQVTGPLDLFNGNVYFGSFESSSGSDACSYGQSRIWGVEYRRGGGVAPTGYAHTLATLTTRFPQASLVDDGGGPNQHFMGPLLNQIVMGVQVTQQITCTTGVDSIDPYIGQRYQVSDAGPGAFQLVAQVSGATGPATPGTSSVRTITQNLPAPAAYTRVFSWVPQADR